MNYIIVDRGGRCNGFYWIKGHIGVPIENEPAHWPLRYVVWSLKHEEKYDWHTSDLSSADRKEICRRIGSDDTQVVGVGGNPSCPAMFAIPLRVIAERGEPRERARAFCRSHDPDRFGKALAEPSDQLKRARVIEDID